MEKKKSSLISSSGWGCRGWEREDQARWPRPDRWSRREQELGWALTVWLRNELRGLDGKQLGSWAQGRGLVGGSAGLLECQVNLFIRQPWREEQVSLGEHPNSALSSPPDFPRRQPACHTVPGIRAGCLPNFGFSEPLIVAI